MVYSATFHAYKTVTEIINSATIAGLVYLTPPPPSVSI